MHVVLCAYVWNLLWFQLSRVEWRLLVKNLYLKLIIFSDKCWSIFWTKWLVLICPLDRDRDREVPLCTVVIVCRNSVEHRSSPLSMFIQFTAFRPRGAFLAPREINTDYVLPSCPYNANIDQHCEVYWKYARSSHVHDGRRGSYLTEWVTGLFLSCHSMTYDDDKSWRQCMTDQLRPAAVITFQVCVNRWVIALVWLLMTTGKRMLCKCKSSWNASMSAVPVRRAASVYNDYVRLSVQFAAFTVYGSRVKREIQRANPSLYSISDHSTAFRKDIYTAGPH